MVNQRMLNSGKQGDGSGLDADTTDGLNANEIKPDGELPYGYSTGELAATLNGLKAETAELMLKNDLLDWNYTDGYIDTFWNQDKVANTSNVTVQEGQNNSGDGKVSLSLDYLDTFEDGDVEGWSGSSNFSVTGNAINGEYSGELYNDADFEGVHKSYSEPRKGNVSLYIEIGNQNADANDDEGIIVYSGGDTGTEIIKIDFEGDGDTTINDGSTSQFSWNPATIYHVEFEMDYSNNEATVKIDGNTVTTESIPSEVDGADTVEVNSYRRISDTAVTVYIDDVIIGNQLSKSGTLTHTQKQLTDQQGNPITPASIVATPEVDTSGSGESVELVLNDNSGNTETLTESDFGTEFSVNFDDGNIQAEPKLYGDGSSSPDWYQTEFLGVDN